MGGIDEAIGRVHAISIGARKGMPKNRVDRAYLREDHGIDGDCHAGPGSRQVSILAREDVLALRRKGITAHPGDFAENMLVDGLNRSKIQIGSNLQIGDALLQITEVGKSDWKAGDYSFKGVALVARCGLFARVICGGCINAGDSIIVE